jgi:hypothetical protein
MDNLSNCGPRDRERISVIEEWELRYWTDKFGVTERELRDAVDEVGPMVKDLARYLEARDEGDRL